MKDKVRAALEQYEDGAITYVEFVRYAWSQVSEQDVLTTELNSRSLDNLIKEARRKSAV